MFDLLLKHSTHVSDHRYFGLFWSPPITNVKVMVIYVSATCLNGSDRLFTRPQVGGKSGLNEGAKQFMVEWADACKYQIDLKYHLMGGGPDAQKVRWSFESAIKYIIICATHLADKDDDVEFKKQVSDFVKDIIIQSLIDVLENLKVKIIYFTGRILPVDFHVRRLRSM